MDKRLLNELGCHSAGMQAICQDLTPCLNTGSPILFWGEAGIGMGFYARAENVYIHDYQGGLESK